jgi:hypothetical protein
MLMFICCEETEMLGRKALEHYCMLLGRVRYWEGDKSKLQSQRSYDQIKVGEVIPLFSLD